MKLDHLLEQIQASGTRIKQEEESSQEHENLTAISAETANKGLMAVGGCRKCAKTFVNRLDLIRHFVDHFPSIFYSFETSTPPNYDFFEQLTQILTTIKPTPVNSDQSAETASSSNIKPSKVQEESKADPLSYHMCPFCCQTFVEATSFENHLKSHTSNALSSPVFQCEQCQMRCNNLYSLEEHRRLHAKLCYICGEQFDTVFDLNVHVGIHCGNPYNCKDCGKAFASRKLLAEHNRIHRLIIESEMPPEPSNKRATTHKEQKSADPDKEDKPESLLSSNLYFNGLSKNITRRRRVRVLRLKSAVSNNFKLSNLQK